MERRVLQGVLALLSLIPVLGLVLSWSTGPGFLLGDAGGQVSTNLDNQFRYLAGVYAAAVSGALWWTIPRIEAHTALLRLAALAVFCGGVGRCISMAAVGLPTEPSMLGGVVLELVVVPLLVLWQRRMVRLAASGEQR